MDAWYLALLPQLLFTLLGWAVFFAVLYQIIWRAVRRGILAARDGQNRP